MRNTRQRQLILEQLRQLTSHPTADELHAMLRQQMPRISLGTVYRNLEILCQQGSIQKLDMGGTQKRFDGRAQNHCHVRCLRCGRVDDIRFSLRQEMEEEAARASGYTIVRHRLDFVGICSACRKDAAPVVSGRSSV